MKLKITNEDIDLFKSMLINWESIEDDLKESYQIDLEEILSLISNEDRKKFLSISDLIEKRMGFRTEEYIKGE